MIKEDPVLAYVAAQKRHEKADAKWRQIRNIVRRMADQMSAVTGPVFGSNRAETLHANDGADFPLFEAEWPTSIRSENCG